MIITIIRHGQTDWNKLGLIQGRIDNPLNETGINQAHQTAIKLKDYPSFDVFYSSHLKRAIKTLDIIKKDLNIENETLIEVDLQEREFGKSEGLKVTKDNTDKVYDGSVEGIETLQELTDRVVRVMTKLYELYPNKRILACSHSHFIKALLLYSLEGFNFRYQLSNSSINTFEVTKELGKLKIKVIEFDK